MPLNRDATAKCYAC